MIRQWLSDTTNIIYNNYQTARARMVLNDGFSMSVQAGRGMYSCPGDNLRDGNYTHVEVGYPSEEEPLLNQYAESSDYTRTVYALVPVEVIDEVIKKHGGIRNARAKG